MRALLLLVVCACGRLGFGASDTPDGATGDGAAGDGAGDGASGDAPVGCSPVYDLCDGFEAGLDTATWQVDPGVTVDTTRAHRGMASVHVTTPALAAGQSAYRSISEGKTLVGGGTTFWVRAWFWLGALPSATNGMELVTAERPGSAGVYVFLFSDRTSVYSQFDTSFEDAMTPAPVGAWFCVVFEVVRSTVASGELSLSGDLPALTLTNTITDGDPPLELVTLGAGFAGSNVDAAQPALDLWIDDVIVHSSPVTCAD